MLRIQALPHKRYHRVINDKKTAVRAIEIAKAAVFLFVTSFQLFQIFFQRPAAVAHDGAVGQPYIADMPGFRDKAGDLLLVFLLADDKTIIPAVGGEPQCLLRALEGGPRHGDIKGQTGMVFAGARIGHGETCG